jgi:hypothetical protein
MVAVRYDQLFDVVKALGPSRADSVARIGKLAHVLDSSIPIPGLGRTIGLDAVLGFIPGVGDAASAVLASYIIWEARRLGLPKRKLARMIGNMALDTTVGAIPLVGDLFDMGYKSNRRNVRMVLDHLAQTGEIPADVAAAARGR